MCIVMKTNSLSRSSYKVILLALAAASLSSCATLQGYKDKIVPEKTQASIDLPQSPSVSGAAPNTRWAEAAPADLPRTDWIAGFNDPVLNGLVQQALSANTDIRFAAERYRAALARLNVSEAELLPTVSASSRVSRTEYGSEFISDSSSLSGGLSANWEFDLWGRIRDGVESSGLEASASKADFAGARLAIAARVTQNWFDLIEARLLAELSERDVETQARALRLTTRRFEGGVTESSDVRLARSTLANSEALRASRLQRQAALARSLEVILREYPDQTLTAAADLPALPRLSGAAGPAYVLRHRPDLLAAERRLTAAGLEVDAARKALLPRLNFDGSTTLSGSALNNIFDIDALIGSLASGLTAPIFQGGRLKANVAQQEALLRQQVENYAGIALDAYLEVENALDADRRLAEREAALRVSLNEAIKAEERLELRYTEGLASILRLLDSQSRRISAESQLISARKERLANRVRLHVALGGGDITQTAVLPDADTSVLPRLTSVQTPAPQTAAPQTTVPAGI